ncbi:hypothetical protein [Streptomyces tendae]|uniref:hypothetical protein n=1 Tax=Streptomyces tendae TaxID=1932 RepID=UPI003716336E
MHNLTNLTSTNAHATQRTARNTQTRNRRSYRLTLAHVKAGDALPAGPREVVVQGEDLGVWIAGQKAARGVLQPAQRFLLEVIGVDPDDASRTRPASRSQDDRWAINLASARQFTPAKATSAPRESTWSSWTVQRSGSGRSSTPSGEGLPS